MLSCGLTSEFYTPAIRTERGILLFPVKSLNLCEFRRVPTEYVSRRVLQALCHILNDICHMDAHCCLSSLVPPLLFTVTH